MCDNIGENALQVEASEDTAEPLNNWVHVNEASVDADAWGQASEDDILEQVKCFCICFVT